MAGAGAPPARDPDGIPFGAFPKAAQHNFGHMPIIVYMTNM